MKRNCYNAGIPFVLLFFSAQVFAGNVTTTLTPSSSIRLRAPDPDGFYWFYTGYVYSVINSGAEVQRSLIAYDLSSIPQNLPIYSATLTIHHTSDHYAGQAEGTSSEVYRTTTPWSRPTWNNSVTGLPVGEWTTPGGDYTGIGGSTTPYATNSDYVANNVDAFLDYDVTTLVSEWYAGTYDNYGLLMSGSTDNMLHFNDPVLTVSYNLDGDNTIELTPASGCRLRAPAPDAMYTGNLYAVCNSGTEVQHSLMAYDFSSIPTGATINSATLTVHHDPIHYAGQAEGQSSYVHRVTTPWTMPATWNNSVIVSEETPWTTPGGDYLGTGGSGTPYAINSDFVANAEEAFMDYDVTNLVSEWHAGTYDNYGFLMSGTDGNLLHFGDPVLTVTYGSTTIPGDANRDGTVDDSDLETLAVNWLVMENATWRMGDFNNDGKVDDLDATILAANWQKTASAASVPEPSMAALLLGCFAMLFCGISSFARRLAP